MTTATRPGLPAYLPESVDRALVVLLELERNDLLTIQEVANRLGIARSSAYRLLKLLEHRRFAEQDPVTKAFRLGPSLGRVARAAVERTERRADLHPLLEHVVAEVDETAHLVALHDGRAFFLDCVEGAKMVRATSQVGEALPAELTAGGRVLLEQRDWALNDGEGEAGLRAVAVLVPGSPDRRRVDMAVAVSGPIERLADERIDELVEVLRDCVVAHADPASS